MHGDEQEDEAAFAEHLRAIGAHHELSADARRMGLDRNTEEGALLSFGSSLRSHKASHRVVAWVLLVAFGFPVALALLKLAGDLFAWLAG